MSAVAVPDAVSKLAAGFSDAAPGHRFLLYLPMWSANGWGLDRGAKTAATKASTHLPDKVRELGQALRGRQQSLAKSQGALTLMAKSTAPFATGLGNEHPIENGFAFLTPYGLPYLAGSGVKGVLRRAAEALVVETPESGWTWLDVWRMFGFEGAAGSVWDDGSEFNRAIKHDLTALACRSDLLDFIARVTDTSERARYLDPKQDGCNDFLRRLVIDKTWRESLHMRGALEFWDCLPDGVLEVDIMTPHQTQYYEGKQTPHDAGQPVPVPFLTVAPGAALDFHVVCREARLPESLRGEPWRALLTKAFAHAFDWLGFGAKTAIGYGAMAPDEPRVKNALQQRAVEQGRQQALAHKAARDEEMSRMSPTQKVMAEFFDSRVDKNQDQRAVFFSALKGGKLGEHRVVVALHLKELMLAQKRWKESTEKKNPDKDPQYKETLQVKEWLKP